MRVRIRKPATDRAKELAMKDVEKFAGKNVPMAIGILEKSIKNSWQGIFELKKQEKDRYHNSEGEDYTVKL